MGPPEPTPGADPLLSFRVDQMGQRLDQLTARVESGFEKLDGRLASLQLIDQIQKRLDGRIDGLEKDTDTKLKAVAKSLSDNWRLSWSVFAILVTAVLGIAAGLVRAFG